MFLVADTDRSDRAAARSPMLGPRRCPEPHAQSAPLPGAPCSEPHARSAPLPGAPCSQRAAAAARSPVFALLPCTERRALSMGLREAARPGSSALRAWGSGQRCAPSMGLRAAARSEHGAPGSGALRAWGSERCQLRRRSDCRAPSNCQLSLPIALSAGDRHVFRLIYC